MNDRHFPKSWPEGCPPAGAEPAHGQVFRVCRTHPPSPEDFMSHAELGKKSSGSECQRHGLSVFRAYRDARHVTQAFPKLGGLIYRADLQPAQGQTQPTPGRDRPSHATWWPYEDVNRAQPFTLADNPLE